MKLSFALIFLSLSNFVFSAEQPKHPKCATSKGQAVVKVKSEKKAN